MGWAISFSIIIYSVFFWTVSTGFSQQNAASFSLFDRFRALCPADKCAIEQFDPELLRDDHQGSVWVAVYRSNNNMPSVLVRDEFLQAMRSAVDSVSMPATDIALQGSFEKPPCPKPSSIPVAVARLRPSSDLKGCWILDSMRCVLPKEKMDNTCDGGSEHAEAISAAIDSLLHYQIASSNYFQGCIRTKATLVSAKLLEDRGFQPVESLQKDMATHTSSLDACLESYAARSISTGSKSIGARDRALDIVSQLGRLDREADLREAANREQNNRDENDPQEYDPWAAVKKFL